MLPIIVIMAIFAASHSYLAGNTVKQAIHNRLGERAYHGFYRFGYNVLAIVTLVPVFALIVLRSGMVMWRVEGGWAIVMISIQLVGVAGVMASLLQTDVMRFAGLRQMQAYFSRQTLPLPDEQLRTNGLYGMVRHPLYLFSLLTIWPMPTMTEALFAFNAGATVYFMIGSLMEERRMLVAFGDAYISYQQRVPWLLPFVQTRNTR